MTTFHEHQLAFGQMSKQHAILYVNRRRCCHRTQQQQYQQQQFSIFNGQFCRF